MVCLSVGMRPASDALALADTLDLAIEADGFFRVRHGSLGRTDREGIYLAGSATGPMDLAAAMAAGRAVASELLADTASAPAKPAASESVLVVGGGVQALQAARALSTLGRSVTLACTEDKLLAETTGAMARFSELLAELDIPLPPFHAQPIAALARAVQDDPNIRVLCNATPARCSGEPGEFAVRLIGPDVDETVQAAAVILAEPAVAAVDPETLGLEMSRSVTNLLGLMLHLRRGLIPRSVAIVLDQAAQQGRLTTELVFAAARALARRGSHRIRIYAHSARVGATGLESLYRTARAAGVEVFRPQSPCRMVEQPDGAIVTARDVQGGELDEAHYDLLVLGDLVRSASLDERLATFHCRPAASQADNVWYLPVRTNRRGIWCLGAVGSDLPAGDLAAQAKLAAAEIYEFLAEKQPSPAEAPDVDAEACVACLTCMRLCPHGAITFDAAEQAALISPATCRRCGICAAECPADAISYPAADDAAAPGSGQSVACFVCENSAAQAVAALTGSNDPSALAANVQLIELPCAGRLDPRTILRMLQDGADRVVVLGCHAGACRYFDGPDRAIRRLARLQQQLAAAGIDPDRLRWGTVTAHQPQRLIDLLTATPQPAD
jgi:quinone-modifying oxidoreductase, subunit QmoB